MLSPFSDELTPPQRLAVAHAAKEVQPAMALLLLFDRRLALVVRQMTEPVIAQMRMAWWREKLALAAELRPAGEPILAELRTLSVDQFPWVEPAMALIIDAWDGLIAAEHWDHDVINQHAGQRANAIFVSLANRLLPNKPSDDVMAVGIGWALADLQILFPELSLITPQKPHQRLPRQLRSLAILERAISLERRQMQGGQSPRLGAWASLLFCALTGR